VFECRQKRLAVKTSGLLLAVVASLSCGAGQHTMEQQDVCNCQPAESASTDFRHAEKHIPLPGKLGSPALSLTVQTILSWPQHESVPDGPRMGRESIEFQVDQAFLQRVSVNSDDCDVTAEISATADKNAPRVMVETPVDAEYCADRQLVQRQLKEKGFDLNVGGELPTPFRVDVRGLPFEDSGPNRGSSRLATTWELHPATINVP
jgi:hypothetical protein